MSKKKLSNKKIKIIRNMVKLRTNKENPRSKPMKKYNR